MDTFNIKYLHQILFLYQLGSPSSWKVNIPFLFLINAADNLKYLELCLSGMSNNNSTRI